MMRHQGEKRFYMCEYKVGTSQSLTDLSWRQPCSHGFFLFGEVATNCAEERLDSFIVVVGSILLTSGVIGDQEIQINAVILIVSQLKIEELVLRIIPIPGSDLY